MLSAGWTLEARTAIALVTAFVVDTFSQRSICQITRSPTLPKSGNQAQGVCQMVCVKDQSYSGRRPSNSIANRLSAGFQF